MSYPLAIFSPVVGAVSETFIRRHMEDLLPGGTVVVAQSAAPPRAGHWSVASPVLTVNGAGPAGVRRFVRAVARELGWARRDGHQSVERFLKIHGVRVGIGEYLDASLSWLAIARKLGIRFFGHAHGYDVSERLRDHRWRVEYLRYNEAAGVITMSEVARTRLIGVGLDPLRIHVVPYGVDVPAQPFPRVDQEAVHCLAVGRMVAKKAPIMTLDAFRRASEAVPRLELDYVGDGALLPAVRQFVRAFELGDRVRLHGAQPSHVVRALLARADIFVQHSMTDPDTGDEEGLPVAILEAMAHSLPVVATHHAGIPEAVVDAGTGYVVPEGDSAGMAERIVTLARNGGLRRTLGRAGWQRVREHFSWDRERAELLRILRLRG